MTSLERSIAQSLDCMGDALKRDGLLLQEQMALRAYERGMRFILERLRMRSAPDMRSRQLPVGDREEAC